MAMGSSPGPVDRAADRFAQGTGLGGRECHLGVIGAEMGRHRSGMGRFVEARFAGAGIGEGDGETAHRPAAAGLQQGRDQGRIHPTGEEGTEGHISQGLLDDHLLQGALELIERGLCATCRGSVLLAKGVAGLLLQVPPGLGFSVLMGWRRAR